ncbi:HD domain-containing protein [Porphyrobacter sp. SLTP]|nr:HD domain-containing protein [Porphyrobacter sp. SLTP]
MQVLNRPLSNVATIISAASFAAEKHREQRRKDVDATPYINHPLDVANILIEARVEDADILAAATLHDTIEDTKTTPEELRERFGERVCSLVLEVTDDKSLDKLERKRLQVLKAPVASDEAKLIKLADKIANLRDMQTPPLGWSDARVGAYIQFAEMVARGCAGVNERLDAMFAEAVEAIRQPRANHADFDSDEPTEELRYERLFKEIFLP